MLVYGSYIQVPNVGVTLFGGYCEAHLFSVPNDCLWYDTLWGPSQRVVTLFGIDWFSERRALPINVLAALILYVLAAFLFYRNHI